MPFLSAAGASSRCYENRVCVHDLRASGHLRQAGGLYSRLELSQLSTSVGLWKSPGSSRVELPRRNKDKDLFLSPGTFSSLYVE